MTDNANRRRTIYAFVERQNIPALVQTFDFANADTSTPRRNQTTVPQQALFLMNSPLVVEQARNVLERPQLQSCAADEEKIRRLYEIIYQRPPRPEEIQMGLAFLAEAATPADSAPALTASEPIRFGKGKGKPGDQMKARREAFAAARKAGVREMKPLGAWAEYAHALLLANETSFVN